MPKPFSLNDMYARYTEGLLDRKKFEGLIFKSILEDIRSFNVYRWKQDDCDDFVSWLYPRFSKAIDSYRNTGASFESYVGAIVRLSAKEYRSRMTDNRVMEYASWTVRVPDLYACQAEEEYLEQETALSHMEPKQTVQLECPEKISDRKKTPRQLLILILKCYYYVSDDFLERIAPLAGIEKEYLKKTINKLRALRLKRDEELRRMKERIHCQFYRCLVYEKRLAAMPENSALFLRTQIRLQRARLRLETMRKRLAKIRPDATNRQIAELLGISKGTVDSSLHALKTRWNNDPNKTILN